MAWLTGCESRLPPLHYYRNGVEQVRIVSSLRNGVLRRWFGVRKTSPYRAAEVRDRLSLDPAQDARTRAVHEMAGRTGLWLPWDCRYHTLQHSLGRGAERLPSILFWYVHGLTFAEIGKRISLLGTESEAESAINVCCQLIAAVLNQRP
jgi:hypothetical protein